MLEQLRSLILPSPTFLLISHLSSLAKQMDDLADAVS
jgi:hypothetical protein